MHQRGHILEVAIHLIQDLGAYRAVSTFCSKASHDKGLPFRMAAVGGTGEQLNIAVLAQRSVINKIIKNRVYKSSIVAFAQELGLKLASVVFPQA